MSAMTNKTVVSFMPFQLIRKDFFLSFGNGTAGFHPHSEKLMRTVVVTSSAFLKTLHTKHHTDKDSIMLYRSKTRGSFVDILTLLADRLPSALDTVDDNILIENFHSSSSGVFFFPLRFSRNNPHLTYSSTTKLVDYLSEFFDVIIFTNFPDNTGFNRYSYPYDNIISFSYNKHQEEASLESHDWIIPVFNDNYLFKGMFSSRRIAGIAVENEDKLLLSTTYHPYLLLNNKRYPFIAPYNTLEHVHMFNIISGKYRLILNDFVSRGILDTIPKPDMLILPTEKTKPSLISKIFNPDAHLIPKKYKKDLMIKNLFPQKYIFSLQGHHAVMKTPEIIKYPEMLSWRNH